MSNVSFTVKTVSGETYRSIDLPDENLEEYMGQLIQIVQEKDKMSSGNLSFMSKNNTYVIIPLSDVAHVGIHNIPPEWLDD